MINTKNSLVTRALRGALGLAIAAGLVVALPTTASAAGPAVRGTSGCPSGKVVLGGGAQVVGQGSADFRTSIQETAPGTIGGGAQSLWLAAVRNADTAAHTIGISAVCAPGPAGYRVVRSDRTVAAHAFLRSSVPCPTGTVVLGGGSSVVGEGSADFATSVQESAPGTINGGTQSVWLTALRNNDVKPHTVGLFALCATNPAGYQVVSKVITVAAGGFLRTTVTCPAGKVVAGGGPNVVGEGSADFRTRLQESSPGTVGAPAQSVWLTAVRNTDARAHTVRVSVVCLTPQTGYQVISKTFTAP